MDFPRFVFKSPGEIKSAGETYDQEIVEDETELKVAVKAGYFETIAEAIAQVPKEKTFKDDVKKKSLFSAKKDDDTDF